MKQDLHAHTRYSYCGKDAVDTIIEAAIEGGLDTFGITDHNYGIGYGRGEGSDSALFSKGEAISASRYQERVNLYFRELDQAKQRYREQLVLLRGIEVCTLSDKAHALYPLPDGVDISFFDYCLVENLDYDETVTEGDIFSYRKRLATPYVGIAHTDLFAHIEKRKEDPLAYFSKMAKENIFWEMNVSFDSIHSYREHAYMLDFFTDPDKQAIVRASGARVSIGFDGHRIEDYLPDRIGFYNDRLEVIGIKKPFEA